MSRAGFVLRPANPENLERPPPGSAADILRVARLAARMLDTLEVTGQSDPPSSRSLSERS
jgi:hypothetical protein